VQFEVDQLEVLQVLAVYPRGHAEYIFMYGFFSRLNNNDTFLIGQIDQLLAFGVSILGDLGLIQHPVL
jgi:hypothetical protein